MHSKSVFFSAHLISFVFFLLILFSLPGHGVCRIYIDINAPSIQKFRIAIPDFKNKTGQNKHKDLATHLTGIFSNDLNLSGYFSLIDKEAFLVEDYEALASGDIRFKDWSVIGAELLLLGSYTCIGDNLEVEMRLFDVFSGMQILGKRVLGDIDSRRYLIHRLSNEIFLTLTGHKGMFLTKLAFVSDVSGHKEIYLCDYDGHNVRPVTNYRNISLLPRLSLDGKKMAYTSYKEGASMLYLKDLASGQVKRLAGKSGLNSGVTWSPGGMKIALTMSQGSNPDIYTMDLNGGRLKRLTNYWGIDVSPSFSPNGNRMAFVSNRSGSPQVYALDLVSGKTERLTFNGRYNTSPTWSSLNRIAFVSMVGGNLDIFTMDANGNELRRLTENQAKNEDPCWSPDGRYIIFSSNRGGPYHLYIMNANGQNQMKLKPFGGNHTSPSWSP